MFFKKLREILLLIPFSLYIILRAIYIKIFIVRSGKNVFQNGNDFDIICITHVSWDHIWQRNHHTMSQLAKHRKVLYCLPEMIHVCLRYPERFKTFFPEEMGNLIYCKIFRLAGEKLPIIYAINKFITEMEIKRLAKKYKFKKSVLWFYFPHQDNIVGSLDEILSLYDIQDNYSAFSWAPKNIVEMEIRLFKKVDIVFTGTDALREKNIANHNNITFFPCGVEFDHFSKTDFSKTPDDIKNLKSPILGYFGLIDNRIDIDLLEYMATKHPEWNIFMIGPVDENLVKKSATKNIYFVGKKEYKILPYYLQKFDVCLMPFAMNELTSKINPTKTLEYFASGKPVVTTAIPDMIKYYSDVLGIAYSKEEFVSLCEEALNKSPKFNIQKGIQLAKNKSWESIVGGMEEIIKKEISKQKQVL